MQTGAFMAALAMHTLWGIASIEVVEVAEEVKNTTGKDTLALVTLTAARTAAAGAAAQLRATTTHKN